MWIESLNKEKLSSGFVAEYVQLKTIKSNAD